MLPAARAILWPRVQDGAARSETCQEATAGRRWGNREREEDSSAHSTPAQQHNQLVSSAGTFSCSGESVETVKAVSEPGPPSSLARRGSGALRLAGLTAGEMNGRGSRRRAEPT